RELDDANRQDEADGISKPRRAFERRRRLRNLHACVENEKQDDEAADDSSGPHLRLRNRARVRSRSHAHPPFHYAIPALQLHVDPPRPKSTQPLTPWGALVDQARAQFNKGVLEIVVPAPP